MGPTPTSVCWVSLVPVSSTKEQGGPRALAALRTDTFIGTDVQSMVSYLEASLLAAFSETGQKELTVLGAGKDANARLTSFLATACFF